MVLTLSCLENVVFACCNDTMATAGRMSVTHDPTQSWLHVFQRLVFQSCFNMSGRMRPNADPASEGQRGQRMIFTGTLPSTTGCFSVVSFIFNQEFPFSETSVKIWTVDQSYHGLLVECISGYHNSICVWGKPHTHTHLSPSTDTWKDDFSVILKGPEGFINTYISFNLLL